MFIEANTKVDGTEYYTKEDGNHDPEGLVECYLQSDPVKAVIVQFQANYIINGENL